ncbi:MULTISPECIES: leucyl aminopeptidase family protein [Gammaproteobacteria]|uniref:leucyl aminopeptidase family protein n=1 Tax=Gammaproteobacteria TaxID=1236 RepID=UPI000DCF8784|nr:MULTISPECIES: leucyl aminopeptidase family protein [Gammaproteobacteria]RTE86851.1 leucyl aminopeptidase family protein [Aliidiomarina sp. B3213]TCZ93360.1 leucyl aminopeptidase family protein [Lysobacter sp. N42]
MALAAPEVLTFEALEGGDWDALIVIGPNFSELDSDYQAAIQNAKMFDASVGETLSVLSCEVAPGNRLLLAPTGPLDRDYDDVRRFYDAAREAVARVAASGAKKPALMVTAVPTGALWNKALASAYFGFNQGNYESLEAREHHGDDVEPFATVGVVGNVDPSFVKSIEAGRRVARDICGTEPERMSPKRAAEYCQEAFAGTSVSVQVIDDRMQLEHEYPLLCAVARASFEVEKQLPAVVRLEFEGEGPIEESIFLVGKGITYDTGGADLKTGGHMAGMSRDKGGAAAVAGFVKALAGLNPKGVKVVAELAFVRNNIDNFAFVADEIITGRSGVRVRIGNTDAEGRLVMADPLAKLTEEAVSATNPSLYTIATLTGHAALAKGPYAALVPNKPAMSKGYVQRILDAGESWGDGVELSPSRREDFDFIRGRTKADDVLSSNNGPSATTVRGHQFPMAFLVAVAGLDKHGQNSDTPLPYTHIDIAGSGVEGGNWQHGKPSASPVIALAGAFLDK